METKQIIIFLIIIAVYLFKVIRKANAKKIENQQNTNPERSSVDEDYEYSTPKTQTYRDVSTETYEEIDYSQMLKNRQKIAESLETSSLEGESYEKNPPQKNNKNTPQKTSQYIDNDIDERFEISTEIDVRERAISIKKEKE